MRTQSQAKTKANYKSTNRVFHAAVPPNPRLRRGLKKEWCLVARKMTFVVCNCVWPLTPLYSKVDQGESAAEGGYGVLAGRHTPPRSHTRLKRPCDRVCHMAFAKLRSQAQVSFAKPRSQEPKLKFPDPPPNLTLA